MILKLNIWYQYLVKKHNRFNMILKTDQLDQTLQEK